MASAVEDVWPCIKELRVWRVEHGEFKCTVECIPNREREHGDPLFPEIESRRIRVLCLL
jgi:hypothetical protein